MGEVGVMKMLLPFSIKYEELLSEAKKQTGRLDVDRWESWIFKDEFEFESLNGAPLYTMLTGNRRLQIYWRTPRIGGLPMGEGYVTHFRIKPYDRIDLQDARRDGFDTLAEFLEALCDRNKTAIPCHQDIALIRWEWVDGPHDVREAVEKKMEEIRVQKAVNRVCVKNALEYGITLTKEMRDACDELDEEGRVCRLCPHICK